MVSLDGFHMSLRVYNQKRKFNQTPEPRGQKKAKSGTKSPLQFVVQMHDASHLHYDFRLEFGGTLKSWAIPKGPSLNPQDQRLAVFVEDHPLDYGDFEGIIPSGNYGGGTVMVWDRGTYLERGSTGRQDSETAMQRGLENGHITFVLDGEKLKGEFALIRLKKDSSNKAWLLVKKRDAHSTYKRGPAGPDLSVKSGRTIDEIAADAEKAGDVWISHKAKRGARSTKPKPTATARSVQARRREKPVPAQSRSAERSVTKTRRRVGVATMPRGLKPMLATLSRTQVNGDDWGYEVSPAGLRALAEVEGSRIHARDCHLIKNFLKSSKP